MAKNSSAKRFLIGACLAVMTCMAQTPVRQRAYGFCEQGGATTVTAGVTSSSMVQGSFPGCLVTVYNSGTTNLATIYSDTNGTVQANPFNADSVTGFWFFYADNGSYDAQLSGAGINPYAVAGILLNAPQPPVPASWLDLTNPPFTDVRNYQFTATNGGTVSGDLSTPGANVLTFTPCPAGVNGTDPTHFLWISGGAGTAEAAAITGGTCTSGAVTGTIDVTTAQVHADAWTVSSATGGIQEAVCASQGGTVSLVPTAYTLHANVGACGLPNPFVDKQSGATISGSFTILSGTSNGSTAPEQFTNKLNEYSTNSNVSTLVDAYRFSANAFPFANEFQGLSMPAQQSLVGAMNETTAGTPSVAVVGIGTSGYSWASNKNAFAVGVYGAGGINYQAANPDSTSAWGANFLVSNYSTSGTDGAAFTQTNLYGVEIDVNLLKSAGMAAPAANVKGLYIVGASSTLPGFGTFNAMEIAPAGVGIHLPWNDGLYTDDEATQVGISLGAATIGNGVGSQPIQFRSRKTDGTNQVSAVQSDPFGDLILAPAASGQVDLEDGNGNVLLQTVPNVGDIQNNSAVIANTTLIVNTAALQPTCDSQLRGGIYLVRGNGTSTADSMQVCHETATGSFAWQVLF